MVTYRDLIDLARSRYINVVEASGLDGRIGARFRGRRGDFIAVDSAAPMTEKVRALGFLLENYPGEGIVSLQCPR